MRRARAFVFAGEEDFGIVLAEAQACGTPVICYRGGGAVEIVCHGRTGLFFDEQTDESIIAAVEEFEGQEEKFDPFDIRRSAERFSVDNVRKRLLRHVEELWGQHGSDGLDHGSIV